MYPRTFSNLFQRAARPARREAFTLLEMMLAVFIISLVMLSVFRFLELNLQAIRLGTEHGADERSIRALVDVLQAEMNALPIVSSQNVLHGEAYKFNEIPQDEMEWQCMAGNGLFTAHAAGDYRATLTLRPVPKTNELELGLRRVQVDGNPDEIHWLPLRRGIRAMEIRYFDPRLNNWLERWVDAAQRPSLIRIRLWRADEKDPYEAILHLPARRARQLPGAPPEPAAE